MSMYRFFFIICALLLVACSEEPAEEKPEAKPHVWQGQVDMLNEAKNVSQEVSEMQQEREEKLRNLK